MIEDVLLITFEMFAKIVLSLGLFVFSILYLTYFSKNWKKTAFFTVGFARTLMYYTSWAVLLISPLGLLLISPEFPATTFFYIIMIPYLTYLGLIVLIASWESWFYLPNLILRITGWDNSTPRIRKGMAQINRFLKKKRGY